MAVAPQTTWMAYPAAHRIVGGAIRSRTVLGKHYGRDQPDRQPQPRGHQDQVVEQTQHGDEVGDQIDGRKGVGRHAERDGLRHPGRAGIPRAEPDGVGVALEAARPAAEAI